MAVRRSLWGSISTSKKVNALSDRAVILYTFAISHLDDEGYIDGDPRLLKSTVVPLRDNIQIKDIPTLMEEISSVHLRVESTPVPLWVVHKTPQGVFIQDPVFNEHQSFKGIRKKQSKIKDVVDMETNGCQKGDVRETKGLTKGEGEGEGKGEGEGEGETILKQKGDNFPPQAFADLFNQITQYLPKIVLTEKRRDKIRVRTRDRPAKDLDWWKTVFEKADMILIPPKRSGDRDWFPTFDWLIDNDNNAVKVFEGNYDDAKRPVSAGKSFDAANLWLNKEGSRDEEGRQKKIFNGDNKNQGESSRDES